VTAAPSAPAAAEETDVAPKEPLSELPRHVEVAIVGAGFGGLGAAITLERAGLRDFAVLERAPEVGGTWFYNSYPGCQCDVPSNLYSFSFARRPDWSRSYPEQPEVLDYLRDCSHRFFVRDRIHVGCAMREAAWDEARQLWHIETSRGSLSARALVCAPGLLSEPKAPSVPGLDGFEGEAVHTARWGDGRDLRGRRVAVVGTGATAVQLVPRLQPEVERLFVFQRTPPWVLPLFDRAVGDGLKRLYRAAPVVQDLARAGVYLLREPLVIAMAIAPRLAKLLEAVSRMHLRRQVADPDLRRLLTPDYVAGCKRVLLTNAWYPALTQPNVELVTEGLGEVRGSTLVGSEGTKAEVDTIVFATGFSPTDPPIAHAVRGPDGRTLAEAWSGGPEAYLGSSVAGFPNLFLLYGPNTNLGHNSIVYMLESQFRYLLAALKAMRERGIGRLEVREDVQRAYNDEIQRRLRGTVWNAGRCASWYLDEQGENPVMWSDFTFRFRRLASRFKLDEHITAPRIEAAGANAPAARGAVA
jgi:cation diffusion facilitator CzcD-associated flavoprotein CzcO